MLVLLSHTFSCFTGRLPLWYSFAYALGPLPFWGASDSTRKEGAGFTQCDAGQVPGKWIYERASELSERVSLRVKRKCTESALVFCIFSYLFSVFSFKFLIALQEDHKEEIIDEHGVDVTDCSLVFGIVDRKGSGNGGVADLFRGRGRLTKKVFAKVLNYMLTYALWSWRRGWGGEGISYFIRPFCFFLWCVL